MLDHEASNKEDIHRAILQKLRGPPPPSSLSLAERPFVIQALKLLIFLDRLDNDLTSLLMMYCGEGDRDVESMAMQYLSSKGVSDPHQYLPRELKERLSSTELVPSTASRELLDLWAEDYLQTLGVKIAGPAAGGKRAGRSGVPGGQQFLTRQQTGGRGRTKAKTTPSLPQYNPVDVLNHFVRMEHERELAR